MDLTQSLRVACEVARLGGFAAAAKSLGLSAPSVSRLIGELEDDLGVRLFARTTRHVSLTEEGQVFVQRSARILEDIAAMREEVSLKETTPEGRIRVSCVVAFGTEVLPAVIARFSEAYPAIEVGLEISNRRVDLVEEHVDIAIRIGSADGLEDSGLIARRIFSQTLIFVGTPEFAAMHPTPAVPDDLRHTPVVRFITGQFGRSHLLRGPGGSEIEFDLPGQMVVDSPIVARNAVLTGRYAGLVADYLVADALKDGRLVRLLPEWSTRPQPIYAVYAHRRLMPARVRVFLDVLTEELQRQGGK